MILGSLFSPLLEEAASTGPNSVGTKNTSSTCRNFSSFLNTRILLNKATYMSTKIAVALMRLIKEKGKWVDAIVTITNQWKEEVFLLQTDLQQQKFVNAALLEGLKGMGKGNLEVRLCFY